MTLIASRIEDKGNFTLNVTACYTDYPTVCDKKAFTILVDGPECFNDNLTFTSEFPLS